MSPPTHGPLTRAPGGHTSRPALIALAALAVAAALLLAGCAGSANDSGGAATIVGMEDTDGYAGVWLDEPYALPDLRFTDTAGRDVALAEVAAAPVSLVFFGYTSCPDVCNAVLADAAAAIRRAEQPVRDGTKLVFITTDPARDTPETMRSYLDRFDPTFEGLTAELTTIENAADQLGVALTGRHELPGGGYDVGHGAQVIGFGPDGLGHVVWSPGTTVGDLRDDITRLAAST